MRAGARGLVAALLLAGAPLWGAPAPDTRTSAQPLDAGSEDDAQGLLPEARALTRRHPGRVELHVYGSSRGGRPLVALCVRGVRPGSGAGQVPALLWTGDLASDRPEDAAELLQRVEELALLRARRGAADPLGEVDWWVLPQPNPDLVHGDAAGAERRRASRLAVDLPTDWDPGFGDGGARPGPWPLCEPETRALEAWLRAHPELVAWVRSDVRPGVDAGNAPPLTGVDGSTGAPGSLERHLVHGLGLTPVSGGSGGPTGLAGALAAVPRWSQGAADVHDLGEGLWQVRLELARSGPTGTQGRLLVRGAEVLHATDAQGRPLTTDAGGSGDLALGTGGEVRLVLRGEARTALSLELREVRTLGCRVGLVLEPATPLAGR